MLNPKATIVYEYNIPVKRLGVPINLIPISDVHYGCAAHASLEWQESLRRWQATNDSNYYIFLGDTIELESDSERKALRGLHETSLARYDDVAHSINQEFIHQIGFMQGRVIGALEGNHRHEFQDGTTDTMRLCQALDTKHLGVIAFVKLNFVYCKKRSDSLNIVAWHGNTGGGYTVGASFNVLQRVSAWSGADIVMSGHDHKKGVLSESKFAGTKDGNIIDRRVLLAKTGSYLRTYVAGEETYFAPRAAFPLEIGNVTIEMTPRRTKDKGFHVDLNYRG
jgi:hypothetical protein